MGLYDKYKITKLDFRPGNVAGAYPVTSKKFNELVELLNSFDHPTDDGVIELDTIIEKTLNNGVNIEGTVFKDTDIYLGGTNAVNDGRIFFDQDANTYLTCTSNNNVSFYSNGNATFFWNAQQFGVSINNFKFDLNGLGYIAFDADDDTYLRSTVDDTLDLYVAGSLNLQYTNGNIAVQDAVNFSFSTTGTGSQIGTGTTQKLAFWGATPIVRPAALTAADASTVDATYGTEEAAVIENLRTRVGELETKLQAIGLLA